MKHLVSLRATAVAALMAPVMVTSPAWASPGAHGPNGEHLDGPNGTAQVSGPIPRMEAKSEDFELVARLAGGEFTMMINRFATGEPVLGAQIEVESGSRKLSVPFHDDMGDYATDDEALLKLLATPGAHPVVITIVAGPDSDLLEGTLNVTAEAAKAFVPGGHDHGWRHGLHKPITWILGFAGLAALAWGVAQWRRKGTSTDNKLGGV
jgi:hypothetical protein